LEQLVYKSNRKLQYDVKKLSITWWLSSAGLSNSMAVDFAYSSSNKPLNLIWYCSFIL
jgi:hypothetical protein